MIKKRVFHVFLLFSLFFISLAFLPTIVAYDNNPSDPKLMDQWGWYNIYADVAYSNGYRGNSSTIVAIIDTGIDLDHPDLQANIFNNTGEIPNNGIDDDLNTFTDDSHGWNFVANNNDTSDHDGHGSHCAGIIAAIDNLIGICGVAPDVTILPIKVIEVESGDLSVLDNAIDYAVLMGADIISMSIGADISPGPLKTSIDNAINAAYTAGVVLVAAAGNDDEFDVSYPAENSQVIAVAAVTKSNEHAPYSNRGPEIDIAAPGGYYNGIISCLNESNYGLSIGTSMATPHVAGVAALLLQWNATLTPAQVLNRITTTAIDLAPAGKDTYTGYGLINTALCLGLPAEHTYNPTWDWFLQNFWWIGLIAAVLFILILYAALKKPKTPKYETSYEYTDYSSTPF